MSDISDPKTIRSSKPFYDIPEISASELIHNLLTALDRESTCIIEANSDLKITINDLLTKSKSIAMSLVDRGVIKSDIILTFAENSIELVTVLFAGMFLGITIYPISPVLNVHELGQLFDTITQIVVFTSKAKSEILSKILRESNRYSRIKFIGILDNIHNSYVPFAKLLKEGQNKSLDTIPYFSINPKKDLFVYIQSSGTSGVPKTVMISHRAIVATIESMTRIDRTALKSMGRLIFSHITPFGCISGITLLIGYIVCGATLVIYRGYDEELILKSVEKYRINILSFVPSFGRKLIYGDLVDKYDLSSVKAMGTSGSALNPKIGAAILNKYKCLVQEVYGMTEYGLITVYPDFENNEYIAGNLGRPADNTLIQVIDINTGLSLGPNIDGEICVKGPKMFSGYLNNITATDEAIDRDKWLHTGDIGHYDEKNRIFITDRLKELIKFGTKQVSPTELELFLMTHECVAEAAVVGVKHQTQSQWPRAYVKCGQNKSVTEEELRKYVSDSLSDSKQLRAGVVFVDQIRRTTVGKVDRRYYKQLVANELIEEK